MIAFRNYVNGTKVADWQDDGGDNIAFSRGAKGFIAINNGKKDKDASYRHPSPTANTATCTPPWTAPRP